MALWAIDSIRVAGGFLSDLSIRLPAGLTCVIGPRGSGKSTLAEAIRLVLGGIPAGVSRPRADLIKANLGGSVLTLTTMAGTDRGGFTIRRAYGQTAVITAPDSRSVTSVDLDRGTFLPMDAYSSLDIEAIADEALGSKRRSLLDDLRASEMQQVHLDLAAHRRSLEANAESIRATERQLGDLREQREELGDAQARLAALPPIGHRVGTPAFQAASKQKLLNQKEAAGLATTTQRLHRLVDDLAGIVSMAKDASSTPLEIAESANISLLREAGQLLRTLWISLEQSMAAASQAVVQSRRELAAVSQRLLEAHSAQEATYLSLQQQNQQAVQAFEARALAERDVAAVAALTQQEADALAKLKALAQERKAIKAAYVLTRDRISELREDVATRLGDEVGPRVRIRVKRHADMLEYQQHLLNALYGSKVRNQDDILRSLVAIRPEDLAVILREDDFTEFETHTAFGKDRGRKIFDALRQNLDSLGLEVLHIDDGVTIELNVATGTSPTFRDASELSRGQKCTALLPILLSRRDSPLLIDQPEDNLDNHFIYETVVESIHRIKTRRQLIFITHNANIPVLGEAELVIVMDSDGHRGYVEKAGTVDECRNEIIDLLEGGEEAFDLRRKRYGSR